jgi:glucose-6-phosphate 1-dehydrogenase
MKEQGSGMEPREANADGRGLTIVVIGASGDLARRKIYPALFALHCQGYLPADFRVFGFARTALDDGQFRARVAEHLTCRYAPGVSCADRMSEFLERCHYQAGRYDSADSFLDLYQMMSRYESGQANRFYYLAVPPAVFLDTARSIGSAGLVRCGGRDPWTRVVVEKPFGRDRASSDALTQDLARIFTEEHTYRIDHYLGKEVIQNLLVLRFANLIFEPLWNRQYVESVRIDWREDVGVEGRGGYFDGYGIVRDVMQNHLLQILALTAMEPPGGADSRHVRDEKVRLLRAVAPARIEDAVLGQYVSATRDGRALPGYGDDPTVSAGSLTPTSASVVLRVENDRWRGVPFLLSAAKAADAQRTEVRIRFRQPTPVCAAVARGGEHQANELAIRVQPDEAILLRILNKTPGAGMKCEPRNLDLRYRLAYKEQIPDAYENLLLDVIRGEKGLFIRNDELAASWDIFTPLLAEWERRRERPLPYAFGSRGPAAANELAARWGIPPAQE